MYMNISLTLLERLTAGVRLRLKCDGTRTENQISSFGETDESI